MMTENIQRKPLNILRWQQNLCVFHNTPFPAEQSS